MRKHTFMVVGFAGLVASAGCKKKEQAAPKPAEPVVVADAAVAVDAEAPKPQIVNTLPADLKWTPFDEKVGEKGGSFAVAYGDPMNGPNGLFIKLPAGNPGMPHTHSNDYHGVSVMGAIAHQQDGKDKAKPLPTGSYWFEPATVPHTSFCPGKEDCIAFVHFNEGKFDVAAAKLDPKGKKSDKYVEKRPADMKFTALMPDVKGGPMISTVWGDDQSGPHGTFWKLPAGFTSPPHTHTADYHAVILKGTVMNDSPDNKAPKEMGPGSYFMQPGGVPHVTACKAGAECLMYSYMVGKFDFLPEGGDAGSAAGSAAGSDAAGSAGSAAPAKDDKQPAEKK